MTLESRKYSSNEEKSRVTDALQYEIIMQMAESAPNWTISDAILEWKKMQIQHFIDEKDITKESAREQLMLIEELVRKAERTIYIAFYWDRIPESNGQQLFQIPLTKENKEQLSIIIKSLSILYFYRNDHDIAAAQATMEQVVSSENTDNIVLSIEMNITTGGVRKIFFTKQMEKKE